MVLKDQRIILAYQKRLKLIVDMTLIVEEISSLGNDLAACYASLALDELIGACEIEVTYQ